MGDDATPKTAVVMDINGLIGAVRDEVSDQVRFVVTLDPHAPTIGFTIPDCGSEEMAYKVKALMTGASLMVDQVFRWTVDDNYEGGDEDEHDPSIA